MAKTVVQNNLRICTILSHRMYVDLNIVQFGWEDCVPSHSFGPATRINYLFHYIISGQGTFIYTDSKGIDHTYHLKRGQGFLITPKQQNTYIADAHNPWEYVWIELSGLRAQEVFALAGLSVDNPIYNSDNPALSQVIKDELLYLVQHDSESAANLFAHMYLFLDALQKSSTTRRIPKNENLKDFYVREAIFFIENNYFSKITVEDIANYCNLNRSYFGKIFREMTHTTPQNFLLRFRMAKACDYLRNSDMPIGEISDAVGYIDSLHFSRAFKSIYHVSPREWRYKNVAE